MNNKQMNNHKKERMMSMVDYSEKELKLRKRIIKFFRGTHERFKKDTNFEKNAKDFIDALFESFHFDEDEQMIDTVMNAYTELKSVLQSKLNTSYEVYKFLKIVDSIYSTEYIKIVERFYR